ncbi:MAG: Holliday junction resolvase YqgF [Candidatus Doudnabacteria bacterium]|nr:Holliday junction resolvase YqgF [Candidatus Doudnabacteria bacterium]
MGRILGIDYGHVRIGMAISDEEQQFAFEYEIWNPKDFFNKIKSLIETKEIKKIVLGLPLNMSGKNSEKTLEVLEFKEKLASLIDIPIETIDERLSSKMAGNIAGTNKNIDSLAAQLFLQNYLNKKNAQKS